MADSESPKGESQRASGRPAMPLGGAIGLATGAVRSAGRLLKSPLRLAGLRRHAAPHARSQPGARPGIESAPDIDRPPPPGTVRIRCIDYGPDRVHAFEVAQEELESFLGGARPEWAAVRWINVDGLHPYIINRFREALGFHTLAAEDVLHVPQRPKVEPYEEEIFVTARMLMLGGQRELLAEQVSMFLFPGRGLLLTFQERSGDVWEPIRARIDNPKSRMRSDGAAYLLYALLDALVDHCFPILEHYGDVLEEVEAQVLERPDPPTLHRLHSIKRELVLLRRVIWPLREAVGELYREESEAIPARTRPYLRDVYDHAVQLIDIIETYREMAGGLTDLYMSAVSNRMNEIMKVLTMMATVFIPLTFIAGIYGMNFEHMPELGWRWAYAGVWASFVAITLALLWYFRRKGWIGR